MQEVGAKMQDANVLEYKNFRYLKAVGWMMLVAIVAYIFHHPEIDPRGNTWLGYTLGSLGALIILILFWYAVVRRRIPVLPERRTLIDKKSMITGRRKKAVFWERRNASTLQGWLSAHIYLGLGLLLLVTLHTGFRFGFNVHTLTYVLMIFVLVTGLYGVYAYLRFPKKMTENLGETSMSTLLSDIATLDNLACQNALHLSDEINEILQKCKRETRIDSNLIALLRGHPLKCATRHAIKQLSPWGDQLNHAQAKILRDIVTLLLRKEAQLKKVRLQLMYKTRLQCWLYTHLLLACSMFGALVAHVTAVFYFG